MKEKLKAEIERLKARLVRGACAAQIEMETNCKEEAYNEVLAILDSLEDDSPKWKKSKRVVVDNDGIICLRKFEGKGWGVYYKDLVIDVEELKKLPVEA